MQFWRLYENFMYRHGEIRNHKWAGEGERVQECMRTSVTVPDWSSKKTQQTPKLGKWDGGGGKNTRQLLFGSKLQKFERDVRPRTPRRMIHCLALACPGMPWQSGRCRSWCPRWGAVVSGILEENTVRFFFFKWIEQ